MTSSILSKDVLAASQLLIVVLVIGIVLCPQLFTRPLSHDLAYYIPILALLSYYFVG